METSADLVQIALLFCVLPLVVLGVLWAALKAGFLSLSSRGWGAWGRNLLGAAILVVVLHLAYVNMNPGAFPWSIIDGALSGKAKGSDVFGRYAAVDKAFASFAEKGNVVLRFQGFNATQVRHLDFIEFEYYRAAYAVYPRRVFCGDVNDVLNSARDVLKVAFNPSEPWLDAHQVATVVTFRVGEQGELILDAKRRGASSRNGAGTVEGGRGE